MLKKTRIYPLNSRDLKRLVVSGNPEYFKFNFKQFEI